jgi:hypothetical protein
MTMVGQEIEQPATVLDLTEDPVGEDSSERTLIASLIEASRLPSWAEDRFKKITDLRRYLEDEVYEFANDNAVNVNVIGRMLNAKAAGMWPENPLLHVTPEHRLRGSSSPLLSAWAKVAGMLANKVADMASISDIFQGATEDTSVDGATWFKVEWVEDPGRDPLGTPRLDDAQDQFRRLRYLAERAAAGEIGEGSAEWQEMRDLHNTIQSYADKMVEQDPRRAQILAMGGQFPTQAHLVPEPLKWKGVEITPVPVENVRLDWELVTSPELLHRGRWLIEVSYQTLDEVATRYDLTPAERGSIGIRRSTSTEQDDTMPASTYQTDPKDREATDTAHGQTIAVYSCWHRLNRRRYVFVDGIGRFLRNDPWPGSLPWVCMAFTRTSGRPIPISIALGAWKIQREVNQILSEGKQARRARFPRYAVKRGMLEPGDMDKLRNALPNAIVEVDEPDDIEKAFKEFRGAEYDPRLYDPYAMIRLMEMEMGVTAQAAGLTSSGSTATEVQTAANHMSMSANMHQSNMHKALKKVYRLIMESIASYMTPEDVAFLLGPMEAQVWAMVPKDREQIIAGLDLDLMVIANGPAGRQALAQAWTAAGDAIARVMQGKTLAAAAGYDLDVGPMVEAITNNMGLGIPGDELVRPMAPMMPAGQPGEPMAGAQPGAGPAQAAAGLVG